MHRVQISKIPTSFNLEFVTIPAAAVDEKSVWGREAPTAVQYVSQSLKIKSKTLYMLTFRVKLDTFNFKMYTNVTRIR